MKKYILQKDLPTFKAGETFHIDNNGNLAADDTKGFPELIAYAASTLRKYPNILTEWFKEVKEVGKTFWYIHADGNRVGRFHTNHWNVQDIDEYNIGNYFETKAQAKRALAKLKAYTTVKRDAKGFKPDWEDFYQEKWYAVLNHRYLDGFHPEVGYQLNFQGTQIIYFATKEDTARSLEIHRKEWELLFDLDLEER